MLTVSQGPTAHWLTILKLILSESSRRILNTTKTVLTVYGTIFLTAARELPAVRSSH